MNVRYLLLLSIALGMSACGGGPEVAADPDFQRHMAKPLPLNKVFTDSLTYGADDRSDWKIFNIDKQGLLTVTIHFDKIDGSCEVYLRDKYGADMGREVQSNNPYLEIVRRVEEPGRFFVWLNSPDAKCSSQYSIEARLDAD